VFFIETKIIAIKSGIERLVEQLGHIHDPGACSAGQSAIKLVYPSRLHRLQVLPKRISPDFFYPPHV